MNERHKPHKRRIKKKKMPGKGEDGHTQTLHTMYKDVAVHGEAWPCIEKRQSLSFLHLIGGW